MDTSTVTSKGQILIPKHLRMKYNIEAGIQVVFEETKAGLLIKPMNEDYFDQFVGLLKDQAPSRKELKLWKAEEKAREEKKLFSSSGSPKRSR